MDVWGWVYQLGRELWDADQDHLADLVFDFSGICLHGTTEAVEAAYEQLLQASQDHSVPWLEVFARHWYLQHQLCKQNNVEVGLPEAVRLLDIAHREENRDCPQSVCAVQDLGIAYGAADGPGYCSERKQVSAETLERINPQWPCFECISAEYAQALIDEEKPQEALDFLDEQIRQLDNPRDVSGEFQKIRAQACLLTDRPERALKLTAGRHDTSGDNVHTALRIFRAQAMLRSGMGDGAKVLPNWTAIEKTPSMGDLWAQALLEMVEAGVFEPDSKRIRKAIEHLHRLAVDLAERGGVRAAFRIAAVVVRLALGRGDRQQAQRSVELLREVLPRLRKPCGADVELAELEVAL